MAEMLVDIERNWADLIVVKAYSGDFINLFKTTWGGAGWQPPRTGWWMREDRATLHLDERDAITAACKILLARYKPEMHDWRAEGF